MSALTVRTVSPPAPLPAPLPAPSAALVMVAGDIDIASALQLRRHLETLRHCDVVLDLSGVTLLAAAGLHVLLDLHVRLGRTGAHLVLAAPTAQVRRVLAAASLHETLATAPSIAEAIERLSPSDAASPSHRLPDGLRQLRLHR
jgi:anti-sigma B factor antagonist